MSVHNHIRNRNGSSRFNHYTNAAHRKISALLGISGQSCSDGIVASSCCSLRNEVLDIVGLVRCCTSFFG